MDKKVILKKSSFFIIIISVMLVGSIGYSAIIKTPPQESLASNPNFPKNESGETYGSGGGVSPIERNLNNPRNSLKLLSDIQDNCMPVLMNPMIINICHIPPCILIIHGEY